MIIVPTILTRDIRAFRSRLHRYTRLFPRIQIDIMDGKFVRTTSLSLQQIPHIKRYRNIFEAHIMATHPEQQIDQLIRKGFSILIFHYEAAAGRQDILSLIRRIKEARRKVGIAISPQTSASRLKPYLRIIDQVTVLGVEPGRNAAPFLPQTLNKVRWLRKQGHCPPIEFDGGVSPKTIQRIADAGARYIASGSFIGKFRDPEKGEALLRAALA